MGTRLSTPDLLSVDDSGALHLWGVRCSGCSTLFFPPQHYGCEVCGADQESLVETLIEPVGRALAIATVHRDLFGHPVPYTIAEIGLDEGPGIRALLASASGEGVEIGSHLRGVLAPTGDSRGKDEVMGVVFELSDPVGPEPSGSSLDEGGE